jgi:hypothetical protein
MLTATLTKPVSVTSLENEAPMFAGVSRMGVARIELATSRV